MRLTLIILRIVLIILFVFTLFIGGLAIASGHNIPDRITHSFQITVIALILIIVLSTYIKSRNLISDLDNFYLQHPEPINECLLALRTIILKQDENITAAWKYRMPFFCYKGKMFCYLWVHKISHQPYIGFVEGKHLDHPDLLLGERSRMKIMLFETDKDLPVEAIEGLMQQALYLYRKGIVKIK